jgi:hypothetical protein
MYLCRMVVGRAQTATSQSVPSYVPSLPISAP